MVHFGKKKLRKCVSVNIYLHAIFCSVLNFLFYGATLLFLKKPLSTIFFTNTVAHHLIFFMNCYPSEIIVRDFLLKVELEAQVEMQEVLDVCYNQYQSAVCPLE